MNDVCGDTLLGEVLIAHEEGWDIEKYLVLRAAGVGHDQALGALASNGGGIQTYIRALRAGYDHQQVMIADGLGISRGELLVCREVGYEYDLLICAVRLGISAPDYLGARRSGASDDEIRQAWDRQPDRFCDYYGMRRLMISHQHTLEVLDSGGSGREYCRQRRAGVGHDRALAAAVGER